MRNRNWNEDFDQINQANVNRMHVTRSGERQYDSGYHNNMGRTSFDQHMQPDYGRRGNSSGDWVNTSPDRYAPDVNRSNYIPDHQQSYANNNGRENHYNRYPGDNASDRGFLGRMGERVGEFLHEGRERVEHLFDRFGNSNQNQGRDNDRGYNQPDYYRNNYNQQQHQSNQNRNNNNSYRNNHLGNRMPERGYENSPYYQGNQGQVQNNRYQPDDYSARSSYRLLDTYSGYGQSGGSYASDRDE